MLRHGSALLTSARHRLVFFALPSKAGVHVLPSVEISHFIVSVEPPAPNSSEQRSRIVVAAVVVIVPVVVQVLPFTVIVPEAMFPRLSNALKVYLCQRYQRFSWLRALLVGCLKAFRHCSLHSRSSG